MKKLLLGLLLLSSSVVAGELPKELSMLTDVGKVVITVKDCQLPNRHGFNLDAYATEKKGDEVIIHKGCWMKQGDVVYIWFYDEETPIVATYKDYHFKPEIKI